MKTVFFFNLAVMAIAALLASGCARAQEPAAAAEPAWPPGTILVEENTAGAVHLNWPGKASPPDKSLSASGGAILEFGAWNKPSSGDKSIVLAPALPNDGVYQVWLRWATLSRLSHAHAEKVPVKIESADGVRQFRFTQRTGNRWVLFGAYRFKAGQNPLVTLSNEGIVGVANFDAARFVPVTPGVARPAPVHAAPRDEFEQLQATLRGLDVAAYFGRGEDDGDVRRKAEENERVARFFWDTMSRDTQAAQVWDDAFVSRGSWTRTLVAGRLRLLAAAYNGSPNLLGTDLRGNPDLLRDLLRALTIFEASYNLTTKWDVNWWDYEIGVPRGLMPTLLLLGDAVPVQQRADYIAAFGRMNATPAKFYNNGFPAKGANLLWNVQNHVVRGALEKDQARLKLCQSLASEPLRYVERDPKAPDKNVEGFYRDGSFIQHGLSYIGAYGYLLLQTYAEIATVLKDSPWKIDDDAARHPYDIVANHISPFVARGETVLTVLGRSTGSINPEDNAADFLITAAMQRPFANERQRAQLEGVVRSWLADDAEGKLLQRALQRADVSVIASLKALKNSAEPPMGQEPGLRVFANMDRAMHRTPHVATALALNSVRTDAFESIWGVNRRGWFQSDGMVLHYTPDWERFRDGYMALVDPYRLPGTTVERFARSEGEGGGVNLGKKGGSDFVGGASLAGVGAVALHLKPREGKLEARKAWFFFGDEIVHLGAGIGADSPNPVETTIENARLLSEQYALLVDGQSVGETATAQTHTGAKWALLKSPRANANLGWVFLEGNPPVNSLVETRKGSRADVQKNGDASPLEMRFATLWMGHGTGLNNGVYAYVTLPGRDAAQMAAYAARPGVQVLANTPDLQAVKRGGVTAIVAYKAGAVDGIAFNTPGVFVVQRDGGKTQIATNDPTMKQSAPAKVTVGDAP